MPHPIASDRLVVEQHGPVIAVRTNHDENRLHPDLLDQLEATLDRVDHADGPGSPVLTGAGKFFSNGPDLDYMSQKPEGPRKRSPGSTHCSGECSASASDRRRHQRTCLRGGAMLALTVDEAVMRSDRGYFCLPEAELGSRHPGHEPAHELNSGERESRFGRSTRSWVGACASTQTEPADRLGSGRRRLLLAVCGRPKQEPVIRLPGPATDRKSRRARRASSHVSRTDRLMGTAYIPMSCLTACLALRWWAEGAVFRNVLLLGVVTVGRWPGRHHTYRTTQAAVNAPHPGAANRARSRPNSTAPSI